MTPTRIASSRTSTPSSDDPCQKNKNRYIYPPNINHNNNTNNSSNNHHSPPPPPSSSPILYADTLYELPSPKDFYSDHVSKRRPVVLRGGVPHVTPKLARAVASLEQLQQMIGSNTMVEVNEQTIKETDNKNTDKNPKDDDIDVLSSFSPQHSRVIRLAFGDFVQQLQRGSTRYYLTTQTLPINDEGQPCLYTTPVTQLVEQDCMDDIRPSLLGNLIPMTCNLWMGQTATSSSSSSSSGLHHDYHDNLYCLLEGQKIFQIAPPESVRHLPMKGTLHTLHDNGRIVYHEQLVLGHDKNNHNKIITMIRPDGALESVERIMELEIRKEQIEQELADQGTEDENKEDGGGDGEGDGGWNKQRRSELEDELNDVEEELLDLNMDHDEMNSADNHDDSGDDDDEDEDDYNNGDLLFGGGKDTKDNRADEEDDDDDDDAENVSNADYVAPDPKRVKRGSLREPHSDQEYEDKDIDEGHHNEDDEKEDPKDKGIPLNFVMRDVNKNIGDTEPAVKFQTIQLYKGDLLYLPAGWFHEVYSQGRQGADNGLHIAFNYWMHPPDVMGDGSGGGVPAAACVAEGSSNGDNPARTISFEHPYRSKFWQRDWDSRKESKL
jgi:hypothetical protein